MKTKQEQIEEMASDICPIHGDCKTCPVNTSCTYLQGASVFFSFANIMLKQIYNEGYRKASDVIDEFASRLIQTVTANNTNEGYLDESVDYACLVEDIEQLAAEMRKEVEK